MAKQENNIVMKNTSGKFGDQVVFRQRAGETILAAPPITDPDRPLTADEELVRYPASLFSCLYAVIVTLINKIVIYGSIIVIYPFFRVVSIIFFQSS